MFAMIRRRLERLSFSWRPLKHFRVAIYSSRSKSLAGRAAMKRYMKKHFAVPLTFSPEHNWDFLHEEFSWPWFKPSAFITIDDRALTFNGTWPTIQALKDFKPWNKKPSMDKFSIVWHDANKEPQCAPNPAYPSGIDVDASLGAQNTCVAELDYPAPRIGAHVVRCNVCGYSIAVSTAGRPDDPRSVRLPCQEKMN